MKRTISILAITGLLGGLAAVSIPAQAVGPKPHIEDPMGDANFVNDQGTGDGSFGDHNQAGAGTVSDLLAVTFSNDAKNLYINIQTQVAPPATTGIGYRVRVNPDDSGTHCLHFEAFFPGANNDLVQGVAHLKDVCEGGDPVEVEVFPGTTITVPRKSHEAFKKGATLAAPQAQAFLYSGTYPTGVAGPTADTTKVGTDFKFVDKKKKKKKKR